MSEAEKARSWWHTLPGIITGVAAVLTAITGLVLALKQTGWFESAPRAPTASAPAASSQKPAGGVTLPDLRDYKLGTATFTLLKGDVSPQTAEKDALRLRIRMTNHARYDVNFWDRSFRFIVGESPIAPESGLNELVAPESAKEGEVIFVIPRGTAAGRLTIGFADTSTEIPLNLPARP